MKHLRGGTKVLAYKPVQACVRLCEYLQCVCNGGSVKRLCYTRHRCCLDWLNESERFRLRHSRRLVCVVCAALMF